MTFEFCIDSFEGALAAQKYGAKRVELCSALDVGGLTPGFGLIQQCATVEGIEVHTMVRPIAGNFVYSATDIEVMKHDIAGAKRAGATGVVFGCLTVNNELDVKATQQLTEFAKSLQLEVTFHRAIDFCNNPIDCLRQLMEMRVDRILTSGGKEKAIDGITTITEMVKLANNQIQIMAGSGVNESNAKQLAETGIDALHFTIHKSNNANEKLGMGSRNEIDEEKILNIMGTFPSNKRG